MIAAVKGAITDFKINFTTYLTGALFDWLTGAVGSIITLPKTFDVKGVLSVILQLAGISWAFIRSKLVNIFGEQKIAYDEKTVDVVKKFVTLALISAAIGFIINGMKLIIPVILDFFARLLNISGIVAAVKKIIDKIAGPIHTAINKVIDWIVGWVKNLIGEVDRELK